MPILINKIEISDDEVHAEMQHHPAGSLDEARHMAAETLVVRELLLQEATNLELIESGDNPLEKQEQAIDALLKQEVTVPEADDKTCKHYYSQNLERFMDKSTGKQLPLESVTTHIRDYLHARSLQMGISQYIKLLARQARIAGFDFEESGNPLVQ